MNLKIPSLKIPSIAGTKVKNNQVVIWAGIALAILIGGLILRHENRKRRGYLPTGKKEDQPNNLNFVYPVVYTKEISPEALTPTKIPAFQLNPDEFFVWDAWVRDKQMAADLMSRGVSHMNVLKAKDVGFELKQGKRFMILYRDWFGSGLVYSNLQSLKDRLAREISNYNPGGIDVLNFDLETDTQTPEYGTVAQQLALYARKELGVKYVDYLGMPLAGEDFGVMGAPLHDSYYAQYLRGAISTDDALIYMPHEYFASGNWLYSAVHTTERGRATDPNLAQLSFFWNKDYQGLTYVPDHICHAIPLFVLFCGGKGLINWNASFIREFYAGDEALISGFYRASLHNDIRRGKPEFLVPEISMDGGKTWLHNDAVTAKKDTMPIIRICKNGSDYVVIGHNPRLNSNPTDVHFRAKGIQDVVRLRDRETYVGRK